MGTRLPLSAYRAISTTEPDVALQLMRMRQPCCHEITPLVSRDWKLLSNAYVMGNVTIVASYSQGYSVEVHPDQHIRVFMPLSGNMALHCAGREFGELGKSDAFFLNHNFGLTTFFPGNSLLLLTAAAEPLAECMRLLDCDADPTLLADRLAGLPDVPGLARLRRVVLNTLWEVEEGFPELAMHDLFRKQREQTLLLQLAAVMSGISNEQQPKVTVHARTLRRALDYVMITPAESFSYSHLAKHAGASLRSVQMAFRAELGLTIRDWTRNHRLDMARDALRRGDEGRNVTKVALTWGFSHLGRFSSAYFARFGEYPSDTVRAAGN